MGDVRGTMYYEDLNTGNRFGTLGRTIVETDVVNFLGLTRMNPPLFSDKEYAKSATFGKIIAPGPLVLIISIGLFYSLGILDKSVLAYLEIDQLKFQAPAPIDDTVHVEAEVISKRETKRPDRGIVIFKLETKNQKGEVVTSWLQTFMVACKRKA